MISGIRQPSWDIYGPRKHQVLPVRAQHCFHTTWTNEQTSRQKSQQGGKWANKRAMSQQAGNEPTSGQMSQWAGKWANERANEPMSGKMRKRVGKWADERENAHLNSLEVLSKRWSSFQWKGGREGGWRSQIPMNQMTWNFWVSVYMIIEHRENGRRKLGRQEPWYPLSNTYDLIWWLFTLKNSNFRPSKITGHRRTDQRANRVMKF